MAFALIVEFLNIAMRKRSRKPVVLKDEHVIE
jgi:hypothetical protein